ncbi:hypothetical protein CVT26_001024 [Gymnopilus dilepis]|uniref:Uncharacterized protein n=1 Tax=Gymnopilus dilepis TaxID=231916 RepID=A0A409Y227_9AGAR|nr:hypothetical protein CVT26_001024 [Gymnopilus dilepis]
MPTTRKQVYVLKEPAEYYNFRLEDGNLLAFPIFVDCEDGKNFVQCDICQAYIRCGGYIDTHRKTGKCFKKAESNKRSREQQLEHQRAREALQELRGAASRLPSNVINSASVQRTDPLSEELENNSVTPTAGLTPRPSRADLHIGVRCEPEAEQHTDLPPSSPPSLKDLYEPPEYDVKTIDESGQEGDWEDDPDTSNTPICPGQRIKWTVGSV